MDKSVNITPNTSGCSMFIIKPCMIQFTNVGVFKIVNEEIGENTSTQNHCMVDPVPCRENQNNMDRHTAEITQKSMCNGSGVKDMNSDNQFLVKGCSGSNDPINNSGISSVIKSRDQNGCVVVNSSDIQEISHISVEMETQNNTRMTPNVSDEGGIINISMKKAYKRPVRACRIKPVSYIGDPIEMEDDLSELDVVQTDSKSKFTNTNKSEKTFSGNANKGSKKDIKRGIKGNCKNGSDTEERKKQSKIFNKNDYHLKDQDTNVQMEKTDLLKCKSRNEFNLKSVHGQLPNKVTDEVMKGKLDKFLEWNAIHKCPLCQDIFIEKEDFKQHIKQSEKCNTVFNGRIRKSKICYCKPCKYQTKGHKHFWAHMFKSGPHGLLGSSSFPKSYDLLDSIDKEFDSKFTLEFDSLRRKWFGSHIKFDELTSSIANNGKCDASVKTKDELDNVDKNKKATIKSTRYCKETGKNEEVDDNDCSCGSEGDCSVVGNNCSETERTTSEDSRYCKETDKNDDVDNDCTIAIKNDCSVVENDCSKTENTTANIYHNNCCNDDDNAFTEESDVESANNCDGSDDCFLTDTAGTDGNSKYANVTRNNKECVGKDHSCTRIKYSSKDAKIEGQNSDCDLKFKIGYFCKYCGVVKRNLRYAVLHLKHAHFSEQPLQCDVCGKTYVEPINLRNHKLTHIHGSHQCDLCGATFNSASGLNYHMHKHKGLKKVKKFKFNCKYCDKKFACRVKRNSHQFVHTGEKPYVCDECGSCFRVKRSLDKHIMFRHTAEEEIEKFLCKVCGKTYNIFYFYIHKRSHEERRYKCNDCGKSFVLKHHLKSHMLSHTNVRLFKCSHCGFSFTLKHHLESHLKTKHDMQNA